MAVKIVLNAVHFWKYKIILGFIMNKITLMVVGNTLQTKSLDLELQKYITLRDTLRHGFRYKFKT